MNFIELMKFNSKKNSSQDELHQAYEVQLRKKFKSRWTSSSLWSSTQKKIRVKMNFIELMKFNSRKNSSQDELQQAYEVQLEKKFESRWTSSSLWSLTRKKIRVKMNFIKLMKFNSEKNSCQDELHQAYEVHLVKKVMDRCT